VVPRALRTRRGDSISVGSSGVGIINSALDDTGEMASGSDERRACLSSRPDDERCSGTRNGGDAPSRVERGDRRRGEPSGERASGDAKRGERSPAISIGALGLDCSNITSELARARSALPEMRRRCGDLPSAPFTSRSVGELDIVVIVRTDGMPPPDCVLSGDITSGATERDTAPLDTAAVSDGFALRLRRVDVADEARRPGSGEMTAGAMGGGELDDESDSDADVVDDDDESDDELDTKPTLYVVLSSSISSWLLEKSWLRESSVTDSPLNGELTRGMSRALNCVSSARSSDDVITPAAASSVSGVLVRSGTMAARHIAWSTVSVS
jgi:hypothetical protein